MLVRAAARPGPSVAVAHSIHPLTGTSTSISCTSYRHTALAEVPPAKEWQAWLGLGFVFRLAGIY
jgi:hypothetical protein